MKDKNEVQPSYYALYFQPDKSHVEAFTYVFLSKADALDKARELAGKDKASYIDWEELEMYSGRVNYGYYGLIDISPYTMGDPIGYYPDNE